jgi:hypothetical protein
MVCFRECSTDRDIGKEAVVGKVVDRPDQAYGMVYAENVASLCRRTEAGALVYVVTLPAASGGESQDPRLAAVGLTG